MNRRFILAFLLAWLLVPLMGAGIQYAKTAAASLFPGGLPSADNVLLMSDGTSGAVQQLPKWSGSDGGIVTIADNGAILSADTDNGAISFKVGNTTHGLGFNTNIVNGPAAFRGGTMIEGWGANGTAPGANGTLNQGSSSVSWDDTYTDDLYLQQSTAGEARIHFEGIAGDSTATIAMDNSSGQYDAIAFNLPGSPVLPASVKSTMVTSAGIRIVQDGGKIEFAGAANFLSYESSSNRIKALGSSTRYWDLDGVFREATVAVNTSLSPDSDGDADIGTAALGFGGIYVAGITAPGTPTTAGVIYVDSADGNLKIKFADGDVVTIATNP